MGKKWKQWQTLFSWAPESLWTITMVFPVVVYGREPKNWCFLTVVLKKTLESPLGSKEIQPVHPKGNQPWIFIGRTDAVAEAPILWPSDEMSRLIGEDPDAGKDWRQREKGMTGWDGWMASPTWWTWGEGQGSLACRKHGIAESQTRLSDWTTATFIRIISGGVSGAPWIMFCICSKLLVSCYILAGVFGSSSSGDSRSVCSFMAGVVLGTEQTRSVKWIPVRRAHCVTEEVTEATSGKSPWYMLLNVLGEREEALWKD